MMLNTYESKRLLDKLANDPRFAYHHDETTNTVDFWRIHDKAPAARFHGGDIGKREDITAEIINTDIQPILGFITDLAEQDA